MDKETPISKYLATLERRQALRERDLMYGSSPTPIVSPPGSRNNNNEMNIRQQLRFEDETFLQPHDQTMMTSSPPTTTTTMGFPTFKPFLPLPPGPSSRSSAAPNFAHKTDNFDGAVVPSSGFKRKRYSFEDKVDEEDHIKKICKYIHTRFIKTH
jgi:hypothetical protein